MGRAAGQPGARVRGYTFPNQLTASRSMPGSRGSNSCRQSRQCGEVNDEQLYRDQMQREQSTGGEPLGEITHSSSWFPRTLIQPLSQSLGPPTIPSSLGLPSSPLWVCPGDTAPIACGHAPGHSRPKSLEGLCASHCRFEGGPRRSTYACRGNGMGHLHQQMRLHVPLKIGVHVLE
eukprot:1158997-Pelagomonas_calceolata.AAC.1